MTPERMVEIIQQWGEPVQQGNVVDFQYKNVPITMIYDIPADRMRLISPVKRQEDLTVEQMVAALSANFHSVIDVRYCLNNGVLWSAFIHPLSDLSALLLASAIQQVTLSNITFGKEYSGGELRFDG